MPGLRTSCASCPLIIGFVTGTITTQPRSWFRVSWFFFPLGLTDHSGVVLPPPPTKAIKSIVCDPVGVEKVNRFPPGRLCHLASWPSRPARGIPVLAAQPVSTRTVFATLSALSPFCLSTANLVPDVCKSWWFSFSLLQDTSRRRKSTVQYGGSNYCSKHCFSVLFFHRALQTSLVPRKAVQGIRLPLYSNQP